MYWLNEKFEICWLGNRKAIPKEEVKRLLIKRVSRSTSNKKYINVADKAEYSDVLHFILMNLKDAVRIQVYSDGVVRIYVDDIFTRRSIWWDTKNVCDDLCNMLALAVFLIDVEDYRPQEK